MSLVCFDIANTLSSGNTFHSFIAATLKVLFTECLNGVVLGLSQRPAQPFCQN